MHVLIGTEIDASELADIFEQKKFDVAQVVQIDGTRVLLREPDGKEWHLTQPDMLCLGMVHGSGDGEIANQIRDWWYNKSGTPLETCHLLPDKRGVPRRAVLAEWICRRLIHLVDILGGETQALLNQNRQLRRSYATLQTAFSRVELFVSGNHLHSPILQYEPTRLVTFWKPKRAGESITQLLPVLSSRLSYFELNFRAPLIVGRGELRIVLRLEPTARVLQEWVVAYTDLLSGWNSFSPAPIVDEPNEVVLECTWSDVTGTPAIGLSSPHWETPYAMSSSTLDGPSQDGPSQSVGVRIWSGLAGVKPPTLPNAPKQAGRLQDRLLTLSPDELVRATQYKSAETIVRDYPSVQYLKDVGRLLVHPHGNVPTIAMLPSPLLEGVTVASADVRTTRKEAPDMAYAMAILYPDVSPEGVFAGGDDESSVGFSGWQLVKGTDAKRLTVLLDRPAGAEMRLFLATRLPKDSSEAGAWATWGAIEIRRGARPETPLSRIAGIPAARQSNSTPMSETPVIGGRADAKHLAGNGLADAELPVHIGRTDAASRHGDQRHPPQRRSRGESAQPDTGHALNPEELEVVDLGEVIPSKLAKLLISGWHAPDHDGVWGVGAESRLAFRLPGSTPAANVRMEVELTVAAADEAEPVLVDMTVNNTSSSRTIFTRPMPQNIELELSDLAPVNLVDLLIRCSRPVCPASLGLGQDQRLLGVRIVQLRLAAVEPAIKGL